ncbi:MAG: hypothetical protein V1861_05200 [Candidatus Micrarchaeota archaeon]
MELNAMMVIQVVLIAGLVCLMLFWFGHPVVMNLLLSAYPDKPPYVCNPFNFSLGLCEGRSDYYCDSVRCAAINQAMAGLIVSDLFLLALTQLAAKSGKKK